MTDSIDESDRAGAVLGVIRMVEEDLPTPTFRMIRRAAGNGYLELRDRVDLNVRPCDHHRFTLDEEWHTITCGDCKEKLDPFAVMMKYAVWYEDFEYKRKRWEQAELEALRAQLRLIRYRVCLSDDDRKAIARGLNQYGKDTLAEVRKLAHDLSDKVRNDEIARHRARREKRSV